MPKFSNASEETADMQRCEAMETRPQDWYARRRKFQFCPECGSKNGMQAVHRETLAEAMPAVLWYKEPGNAEYLFYSCPYCNHWRIVPDGYAHASLDDISAWLCANPMAPDYEALAAEELVSQNEDSRDSAEI